MNSKKTIEDFIDILCATFLKIGINEISIYEIDTIIKIAQVVPEFTLLSEKFNLKEIFSFSTFLKACSNDGSIEENCMLKINLSKEEVNEILNKNLFAKREISNIIAANIALNQLGETTNYIANYDFQSPDSIQQIALYDYQPFKGESILFTDGDINEFGTNHYIVNGHSMYVNNIKITNSTYSAIVTKTDKEITDINIRSKYLSDGFIVTETQNILNGKIEQYRQINKGNPKIYRLLRH